MTTETIKQYKNKLTNEIKEIVNNIEDLNDSEELVSKILSYVDEVESNKKESKEYILTKSILESFRDYITSTDVDDVIDPYYVEEECGEYYVKNLGLGNYCLSINDKGLISLHDEDGREIWHLGTDVIEKYRVYSHAVIVEFLKDFVYSNFDSLRESNKLLLAA